VYGIEQGSGAMLDRELLSRLEALAEQLEIPVRYASLATEELAGRGGLCVLRGERQIIIERTLGDRGRQARGKCGRSVSSRQPWVKWRSRNSA
jgi:hypothetical protein